MSSFTFYQRAELTIHTENLLVECGPSDRPLACGHLAWWRGLQQPPMEKQTRADVLRPHVPRPPPVGSTRQGGLAIYLFLLRHQGNKTVWLSFGFFFTWLSST